MITKTIIVIKDKNKCENDQIPSSIKLFLSSCDNNGYFKSSKSNNHKINYQIS